MKKTYFKFLSQHHRETCDTKKFCKKKKDTVNYINTTYWYILKCPSMYCS